MLKKLQNLLFEDDDDEYMDEDEEEVVKKEKVKPQEVATPGETSKPAPISHEEKVSEAPKLNRIDVTSAIPTPTPSPIIKKTEPVNEEKKPSINITVDDPYQKAIEKKVVKQTKPSKKPEKKTKPSYEFQPVISPIFGVDEKDMNALKTTTQKVAMITSEEEDPGNITPVISPIYGSTSSFRVIKDEDLSGVNNSPVLDKANPTAKTPEDELADFSLDDILKIRDKEYSDALSKDDDLFPDLDFDDGDDSTPDFPDEIDQTLVIDKKNLKK